MRTFDQTASAARFLLGGIGTGNISLDQNARLCDFELFNQPNKGFRSPYTFFAVRTATPDGDVKVKALESQLMPPFTNSHGANAWDIGGLPRFRQSEMTGNYPFVNYTLTDTAMPIEANIEAFTPLIPLATDDSSLPAAVLRYRIKNITDQPLTISVAGSMSNLSEMSDRDIWTKPLYGRKSINKFVDNQVSRGIHFLPAEGRTEAEHDYFEMALLTTEKEGISYLDDWNEAAWWDGIQDFWNDFSADGELTPGRTLLGKGNSLHVSQIPMASLCVKKEIPAGGEATFEFIISWYHPNRIRNWEQACCPPQAGCCGGDEALVTLRNYYAKFGNALASAKHLITELPRLESQSRLFANALTSGSLPDYALEAVSANITVIRSTTCFRVEDGTFFAWEGCFDGEGCCAGSCTHVWNYTQTLAFLFPELERSMRETEFLTETESDGYMNFRALEYLVRFDEVKDDNAEMTNSSNPKKAAADGQLGTVIRLYRDWLICGDDDFLKTMWPKAKLTLEYAFKHWDKDGDGVIESEAHNTYDIEFFGISSMLNSVFYAALRAGEKISEYLGDTESAQKYADLAMMGAKIVDAQTFNGEYYEQQIENVNDYKYQYGKGCLSDQLFGQQLAHVSGLGHILDEANVKSAIYSVYKYNFLEDFSDFANMQRMYALNDNSGLVLCNWPHGERPEIPFVYSDEVWTGIEYQVASHLIYEGFVEEGLKIVKAVRDRHDGIQRSPWNEVECGHHYARSLASYGVLLALTGFQCDAVNKVLTFKPAMNEANFEAFFSCGAGWGIYRQTKQADGTLNYGIETLYGHLDDYTIKVIND